MAVPNNETRPNQGEGNVFKEFMDKLLKERRIELGNFSAELLAKYGVLNIAIFKNDVIKVRSGGYEIRIKDNIVMVFKEKKVETNGRTVYIYEQTHTYVSNCLAKNIKELLFKLLEEYNYKVVENKWLGAKLPRSDRRVRLLQSWIIATINGFDRPMHDSPLNC
jgi:hypothetical protein